MNHMILGFVFFSLITNPKKKIQSRNVETTKTRRNVTSRHKHFHASLSPTPIFRSSTSQFQHENVVLISTIIYVDVVQDIRRLGSVNAQMSKEISISCQPLAKTGRQHYIDVRFDSPSENLDYLVFQNYYTSSLTISQQVRGSEYSPILVDKILMPFPDCENGSQSLFSISIDEFSSFSSGKSLRIYLFQPSPCWQHFEIRTLKAFKKTSEKHSTNIGMSSPSSKILDHSNICSLICADLKTLLEAHKKKTFSKAVDFGGDAPIDFKRTTGKKREKTKKGKH